MCLDLLDTSKTAIAEKDMAFYKIVRCKINKFGGGIIEYYTPYRDYKIVPGVTYVERGSEFTNCGNRRDFLGRRVDFVESGGYHLFVRRADAEHCANSFINTKGHYFDIVTLVVKAIVPKGTPYINGRFDNCPCVCTKAVRYEVIGDPKAEYYGLEKLPLPY